MWYYWPKSRQKPHKAPKMKDTVRTHKTGVICIFLLAVLIAVTFYDTLNYGFVYDDNIQIIDNPWLTSFNNLYSIFTTHSFGFMEEPTSARSYRPVVFLIYMTEYALFGLKPAGWHLFNIVLHALNSFLVYLIIMKLVSPDARLGTKSEGKWTAYVPAASGAALFAVHPAKSEAVSWVGCVPELSYTLFTLTAFYLYLKSDDYAGKRFAPGALMSLAGVCFLAALLSKETAIVLPFIILTHDLTQSGIKGFLRKLPVKRYLPLATAGLVYFALRGNALGGEFAVTDRMYGFLTPWQYLLTAASFFAGYMKMLVFPVGNYPFQVFSPVLSLSEPRALFSIFTIILSAALFVTALRRPVWAIAAIIILLPLIPALYIPGMSRHPFSERYIYLPSAGFSMAAALFFQRSVRLKHAMPPFRTIAALFVAISLLAAWTWNKNRNWRDDVAVWRSSIAASPENYFAHYWLGLSYFKNDRLDEAISHSRESVRQNSSREHRDVMIEVAARKTVASSYDRKRMYSDAIREYHEILRLDPNDFSSNYNIAFAYQESGLFDDAIFWYGKALKAARKPADARDTYNNLANCYVRKRLIADAIAVYEDALNAFPGDELLLKNMTIVRRMANAGG